MKILLAVIFIAHFPVHAQESNANDKAAPNSGRLVWFVATDIPENVANPTKVMSGKKLSEITLSKNYVSNPVKIPEDGIVSLVREAPNPEKPGETLFITLAQAQIAADVNQALVILVPYPEPKGDRVFVSKVQNLADFKGGDWLFLNLTTSDIGIQFGEDKTLVKSGGVGIRNARELKSNMDVPLAYNYRLAGEKEWKLITATTVVVMPTRRELCIFSPNPHNGRISYHGVTFPVQQ